MSQFKREARLMVAIALSPFVLAFLFALIGPFVLSRG